MRQRNADVANSNHHSCTVILRTADGNALTCNARNPAVQRLRCAGDTAGSHNNALIGLDVLGFVAFTYLNADNGVSSWVIVELGNAHTVVDLDTALVELFDQNFNVVTALERVLTVSAQTAVAGIRFKVMFGKTGVFKEVECFAGVLCEAVNRFLQAHVVTISHDVFGELLPGVFTAFGVGILHLGTPSCEQAAAEVGSCMEGRLTCVINGNFTAGIVCLTGGHHTGTAAAQDDDVNCVIPFGRKIVSGSGSSHCRSSDSANGSSSGCSKESTTRYACHFIILLSS